MDRIIQIVLGTDFRYSPNRRFNDYSNAVWNIRLRDGNFVQDMVFYKAVFYEAVSFAAAQPGNEALLLELRGFLSLFIPGVGLREVPSREIWDAFDAAVEELYSRGWNCYLVEEGGSVIIRFYNSCCPAACPPAAAA